MPVTSFLPGELITVTLTEGVQSTVGAALQPYTFQFFAAANGCNPNPITFTDSGQMLGALNTQGLDLGDVNGDGDLDALMGNGFGGSLTNEFFTNDVGPGPLPTAGSSSPSPTMTGRKPEWGRGGAGRPVDRAICRWTSVSALFVVKNHDAIYSSPNFRYGPRSSVSLLSCSMTSPKPVFQPFNPHEAVIIYRRSLPHWRQEGATYFVTFRLADSIPRSRLAAWEEERRLWLKARNIDYDPASDTWREAYVKLPLRDRRQFEKGNARRLQEYLDQGHGSCLLKRSAYPEIIRDALLYFHGNRCWTGDFVVLPNHVHALIAPFPSHTLEKILQSIKRHSARRINQEHGVEKRFWKRDTYDHITRDRKELRAFRSYIQNNPAKAGLGPAGALYYRAAWLDEFTET